MKIKVSDAAIMLGVSEQCIRIGLQRGKFNFGVAFKKEGNSKYKYVIYPEMLKNAVGSDIFENYIKNSASM